MEPGGQVEHAGMGEQSEGGYGGVDVEAGRKADGHDQADELRTHELRTTKLHDCQHTRARPRRQYPQINAPQIEKGRFGRPSLRIRPPCGYRVDSISKPQASSNGSGMYLEFLFRRAHSRSRVDRKYWSGVNLYSLTTCSNSVTVGMTGPIGSGFSQLGFPRRLAMKNIPSYAWNQDFIRNLSL